MKEWMTAQEIASEGLPQMPATKMGVLNMAERESWDTNPFRARKRSGRGGGMEYHIGLLPSLAQVAYRQRSIPVGPLPEVPASHLATPLTGRAALERDARLAILRAYEVFERGQRLNRQGCQYLFVSKYQAGTFAIDPWVRELVPSFSVRTLARWRAEAAADASNLGFDRSASRKGTGIIETANDGAVQTFILGLIAHQPHLSAGQVRTQCRAEFGDTIQALRGSGVIETVAMPPLRTFQEALKVMKVTKKVILTKLTNPDLYRSTMKLSGTGSLRHIGQPNQLWQIDASPVDALCTDGRHSIYVCVDIATRRPKLYLTKTPRAAAVGLLLRKAIIAWGVPAEIKTDNGSDFTARASKRLLHSLGIEMTLSDAFSPEQKGFVERLIGTFQRDAVALMPGFIGHSVADRKAIESRKSFAQRLGEDDAETFAVQCTAAEMQAHFDAWVDLKYSHDVHATLGRSPFAAASATDHTVRRVDERALDLLLAPMAKGDGTRTTTKVGIRVDGIQYLNGSILPGTRVFVRHDPQDLGRVFLFGTAEGDFLGEAVNVELAGLPPEVMVRAQRQLQAETMEHDRLAMEAVRRKLRKGPSLIERAQDVWRRDQPNVVVLPRPEVEHSTADIAAALKAATHRDQVPATTMADPVAERLTRLRQQEREPSNVKPIRQQIETPELRFRWALDLEAQLAAGVAVDPAEILKLGAFQGSAEYRVRRKIHDRQQAEKAAL